MDSNSSYWNFREVQFKSWDEMIIINFPKGMDIKDLVEIVICDMITELIFFFKMLVV